MITMWEKLALLSGTVQEGLVLVKLNLYPMTICHLSVVTTGVNTTHNIVLVVLPLE